MESPDQRKSIQVHGRLLRIARLDAENFFFLSDPAAFVDLLRKSGQKIDLFTFQQPPVDPVPHHPYHQEWDEIATIPISTYEHWYANLIPVTTRRHVKKSAKYNVTLRETQFDDELVDGVWKIYRETPIRQGRPFPHYHDTLEKVRHDLSTYLDSSIFVGAYHEGQLIGFLKLIQDEAATQLNLMHILSLNSERDKAPTNGLLAEAVRICEKRKLAFFSYLLMRYGNKKTDGLSNFKMKNGFQAMCTPRYYVPLTLWGRVALALGLHHRFVDRLPSGFASRLRALRTWMLTKNLPAGNTGSAADSNRHEEES